MKAHYKLDYWESNSLELLRRATTPNGIKASCTDITNYGSVFTRDAVMAGIAGLLYGDTVVINGMKSTVEMLFKTKGPQGQIASNFKMVHDEVEHISYGTLSPKIDSATWYLVAIGLLMDKGIKYDLEYVESTILLLDALEYNGNDLMYIPQGGNWADEYPYEGYILYDQVLRAWALELLGKHFKNETWSLKSGAIKEKIKAKYFNKSKGYYNCTFRPSGVNDTFDFAAHNLFGLLDSQMASKEYIISLDWIIGKFLSKGNLPGAFYPVIDEEHPKWGLLSNFHLFDFKNKPHHYHNGGIWFIWLGWFALVLHKHGKYDALSQLCDLSFDLLNKVKDFNFDEYLSADTKDPMGTQELCYTATGILFLCKTAKSKDSQIDLL